MKDKKVRNKRLFDLKPYVNKRTKQITLILPKKQVKLFNKENKDPKSIKIEIKEIKW